MTSYAFVAPLWAWDAGSKGTWMFVTLPLELSEEIREVGALAGPPRGFGSLPVEVRVGGSVWRTSVFPDRNTRCYVLPVKAAVRKAEDLEVEDRIAVSLQPLV